MDYEEIIEGLEKFHNRILKTNLSYHIWESEMMSVVEAFNLLKTQRETIDRLSKEKLGLEQDLNLVKDELLDVIYRQDKEIERLQLEVEAVNEIINPLPFKSNFDKAIYEAKSEAYKEFAKRLLDKAVTSRGSPYAMYKKIDYYDVRKTLAELTERKEDKK